MQKKLIAALVVAAAVSTPAFAQPLEAAVASSRVSQRLGDQNRETRRINQRMLYFTTRERMTWSQAANIEFAPDRGFCREWRRAMYSQPGYRELRYRRLLESVVSVFRYPYVAPLNVSQAFQGRDDVDQQIIQTCS